MKIRQQESWNRSTGDVAKDNFHITLTIGQLDPFDPVIIEDGHWFRGMHACTSTARKGPCQDDNLPI